MKEIAWDMIHAQAEEVSYLRARNQDGNSVGEAYDYGSGKIFDGSAHARHAQKHQQNASHHGAGKEAINAVLGDDPGHGERQGHQSDGYACDEVGMKFVAVIVAQQDYGFGQPGI
jgi:hypothetical protein